MSANDKFIPLHRKCRAKVPLSVYLARKCPNHKNKVQELRKLLVLKIWVRYLERLKMEQKEREAKRRRMKLEYLENQKASLAYMMTPNLMESKNTPVQSFQYS